MNVKNIKAKSYHARNNLRTTGQLYQTVCLIVHVKHLFYPLNGVTQISERI